MKVKICGLTTADQVKTCINNGANYCGFILNYKQFQSVADIILWDSSGLEHSLDWNFNWIRSVPNNFTKMIAGNININKIKKILKLADIADVSGALETNKVKDIIKIKNFLNTFKKLNNEN